jgi:hypothetical protein
VKYTYDIRVGQIFAGLKLIFNLFSIIYEFSKLILTGFGMQFATLQRIEKI